ncbi:MAG: sigma-54 dependent transcriptional regulator [Candidatus Delongbacteria bacterium]|jgi:transcriptional regulator with PAS, ATPase and Fis domain|nr:sigma-54 dependent transcriptional regulator [Candidatus Delongbacteria bacterium]
MKKRKIKILPIPEPSWELMNKPYTSIAQLLFYLEVLRGEVLSRNSEENEKKKISGLLDSFKSLLLNIDDFSKDIEVDVVSSSDNCGAYNFPGFIGNNEIIREIIEDSAKWAKTPYPVFITGETGTGKEMFARLIHHISGKVPFIPINCSAIPSTLIESELFGHTKGAFTGADKQRAGKFEEANGGSIFLDEIGELEEYIQVKLLRVIQFGEIQKLGADKITKVNVRIIAATNKNIKEQIATGKLREDLYYRLSCCEIKIPPLRERRDEIPELLKFFMHKCSLEINKPLPRLSNGLKKFLYEEYSFPGNVRELENIAKRISVFGNDNLIKSKLISESYTRINNINCSSILSDKLSGVTEELLKSTLARWKGSVQRSSSELSISESRFYQLCRKFKIKPSDFRRAEE